MHFTIITPSFNQLDYLKRCVASVRDQVAVISPQPLANSSIENQVEANSHQLIANRSTQGSANSHQLKANSSIEDQVEANSHQLKANSFISVHHHVQDGASADGTRESLAEHLANSFELKANSHQPIANGYAFSFASEADDGMYDAVNRGVKLAIGSVSPELLALSPKLKAKSQDVAVSPEPLATSPKLKAKSQEAADRTELLANGQKLKSKSSPVALSPKLKAESSPVAVSPELLALSPKLKAKSQDVADGTEPLATSPKLKAKSQDVADGTEPLATSPKLKAKSQDVADGTELLANGQKLKAKSSSDDSIVAWLNCDEQYLPGTLQKVADYFASHPKVDILFGGMLMVDEKDELLACRKAMPMRKLFLEASYLYNFSCAMFFRKSVWDKLGGFDVAFKNAGDENLVRRAMKLGAKTAVLDDYLATFTYSDTNLSSDQKALLEHEMLKRSGSVLGRVFKLPINLLRLTEKFLRGGHIQRDPVEYKIYAEDSDERTLFRCKNPSCKWPDQQTPYLTSHRLKNI